MSTLERLRWILVLIVCATVFVPPGVALVRDLRDPSLGGPGIPRRAVDVHRHVSPRLATWARERIATGRAAGASLHDVPTTEWPMFTSVFYLLGTEQLEGAWQRGELAPGDAEPLSYARDAVDAARDLVVDPVHHTWVRTHWGEDYLHRENVFFRALLIAGLTSHFALTHDPADEPMLRDQVETLAAALDGSPLGLLDDYPDECYPIDVLVAVAWIRRADAVLGTDHRAFVARSLRAFTGAQADAAGLVRYRVLLAPGNAVADELQPARGVGMSWVLAFTPDLWPAQSAEWYERYAAAFWQDHGWAAGFREWGAGSSPENGFEIDAGPVVDGFGTAASAFGIAAARRHGRFDHAFALESEMSAASWTLPDGTMFFPRAVSHGAEAPHLGESALMYFLTVQPAEGVTVVRGDRHLPGLVCFGLAVYFGVPALALVALVRRAWRVRGEGRDQQRTKRTRSPTANPGASPASRSSAVARPSKRQPPGVAAG